MILKKTISLLPFLLMICLQSILAQGTVTISGYVVDAQRNPIELATISDLKGSAATYTDDKGFYSIQFPRADTIVLKYSCISYQQATRIIPVEMNNLQVNVILGTFSRDLQEITVKGQRRQTSTLQTLDASRIRMLPDASGGSIEALLVTFAGVSSNNELSSQYSVRGGNYDENLVYVNGTEVYRPLLIRWSTGRTEFYQSGNGGGSPVFCRRF